MVVAYTHDVNHNTVTSMSGASFEDIRRADNQGKPVCYAFSECRGYQAMRRAHLHASRPSNKSLSVLFRTVISTQIVTRDLCEATFASEIGPRDSGRPFGQETARHFPDQRNSEVQRKVLIIIHF